MVATQDIPPTEPTTLDADWVLTMNGPVIHNGRIVLREGRVVAVGPANEVAVLGRHIPQGPAVLMPGLINAHCHLELSAYHGILPPGDFFDWIAELVRLRLQPDAAGTEQTAVPHAVQSMLASGTTCVGDISRAAWLPAVLATLPIRKVCYVELISGAMFPPADVTQLRQRLDELSKDDPLLIPAISPHAPYTVLQADLLACAELARVRSLPVAMHLAETREEIEWLRDGTGRIAQWHCEAFKTWPESPRCGPSEYAMTAGLTPAALVHMNYADDWQTLGSLPRQRQPSIIYCPRSHRFFGHSPHPFRQMLEAGLKVAIGTDSAASHRSDELRPTSVLDEIRWLQREYPEIPARTVLEMATVHGAAALGLSGKIGRILPGMAADLVGFAVERSSPVDPAAAIVNGQQLPSLICIAGRILHM